MPTFSTSSQRNLIRALLKRKEWPTDRVTVMHRDAFQKAGIVWRDGAELDAELSMLSAPRASALIFQLEDFD